MMVILQFFLPWSLICRYGIRQARNATRRLLLVLARFAAQVFEMCNMRYFNRELYEKAEHDLKEHVEIWQVRCCPALHTCYCMQRRTAVGASALVNLNTYDADTSTEFHAVLPYQICHPLPPMAHCTCVSAHGYPVTPP